LIDGRLFMKRFSFLFSGTFVLLFLLSVSPATVQADGTSDDNAQDDTRILVAAVNADAGTVTLEYMSKRTKHTYGVDAATVVTVNDSRAGLADIVKGMQVRDSVERDSSTLDSISVSPADPAPPDSEGDK
jgi:hypothetical protein